MRWQHIQRGAPAYGPRAVTILSTPLYSNTTMASFMPTVGSGGQVVLMKKFYARGFLELAAPERATNTRLEIGRRNVLNPVIIDNIEHRHRFRKKNEHKCIKHKHT